MGLMRCVRNVGKDVPDDWGTVASSGYGLMVVKTTDSAADAEQTALSGASRRPPNAQACPACKVSSVAVIARVKARAPVRPRNTTTLARQAFRASTLSTRQ